MELDITDFLTNSDPMDYSASVAEIGQDAGRITWRNAQSDVADYPLLDDDDKLDAARRFFRGFGAWDDDEITAMSDTDLTALLIQMIAGDIRDFNELAHGNWKEWEALANYGTVCSRLYGGELTTDGRVYYSIDE